MSGPLTIELAPSAEPLVEGGSLTLLGRYRNSGSEPLALTFWWNRRMRVTDTEGRVVAPGPGPVLPCGAGEMATTLAPGELLERAEPLGCTQPAGRTESIGWSHALPAGRYRGVLEFACPPEHGFSQCDEPVWQGRAESNALEFEVLPRPPTVLERIKGLFGG